MAKVTEQQRELYSRLINSYKAKIETNLKEIRTLGIKAGQDKENEPKYRLKMIGYHLDNISIYCAMNEVSLSLMDVKNSAFLDKARLELYEVLIALEKLVTKFIDVPFSDLQESLDKLTDLNDVDKLNLMKKIGYCMSLIIEEFGENTKWKWSFIEIQGRFAVVAKNIFDFKKYQKLDNPSAPGYVERRNHLTLIINQLTNASNGYREKFELSTKEIEDIKKAIDFQKALYRILNVIGDQKKIEACKKQIEVWQVLLEKQELQNNTKKKETK